jgi:hypothetical protein
MSKGRGKLIDTWTWRKAGIPEVKLQVRMYKGDWPSYIPEFEVLHTGLNLHARGSDLATLKKQLFDELEKKYSITWTLYLQVTYEGTHSLVRGDGSVESWEEHAENHRLDSDATEDSMWGPREFNENMYFGLKVEEVEEGVYPNGEKCHRDRNSQHISSGTLHSGVIRGRSYRGEEGQIAFLPATRENRQALHRLFQAYAALDLKVRDLLKQENLQATLEKIMLGMGAMPLALPAPAAVQGKTDFKFSEPDDPEEKPKGKKTRKLHFQADPSLAEELPELAREKSNDPPAPDPGERKPGQRRPARLSASDQRGPALRKHRSRRRPDTSL